MSEWSIEIAGEEFAKFVRSLPAYERAVLTAAVDHILAERGIDVCAGEWGKPLGGGLYEFRIRKGLAAVRGEADVESPEPGGHRSVLLRVFCTFHGHKVVLLFHGYDMKRDPSPRRQQREIAKARRLLNEWRRQNRC